MQRHIINHKKIKGKKTKVIWKAADDLFTVEAQKRLDRAFDVLFNEISTKLISYQKLQGEILH